MQYFVSSDSSSSPPPIPDISSSSVPVPSTLSSSAVVDGDAREPPLRRLLLLDPDLAVRAVLRSGWCGFALLTVSACLCGCTLPARDPAGVPVLGVPAPTEGCLASPDAGGGRVPKLPGGRRLLPSLPTDTSRSWRVIAWIALCALVRLCRFIIACACIDCIEGRFLLFAPTAFWRRAMAAADTRFGAPPP